VVGGVVGEWWILAVGLRLDANAGWFFSVASSGLSLGSDSRGLLDPEHGERCEGGSTHAR
jgi:hypothetical protein